MVKRHNEPEIQFCVEVRLMPGCEVVERYTIEQSCGFRWTKKNACRIYAQVLESLARLAVKTNCSYEIVAWGRPEDRSDWIAGYPIEGKYEQLSLEVDNG